MFKRLSISLLVMGLAAFGLGAAAFAWFSDSGSAGVQVTSGTVNLNFRVDFDCNGGPMDGFDTGFLDFATPPNVDDFSWNGIVPGDTTADCIEVLNAGTNGDLAVFAKHSGFAGDNALRNATLWQYNSDGTGFTDCLPTSPQNAQYTSGRGCALGTLVPGASFLLRVDVSFPDNGEDQDALQGLAFNFISTLTGYTS